MTIDTHRELLRKYWGYDNFRGVQREIIDSVCAGRDTLGLMPTGGGKSITFQVPALAMRGVCLVITPLVALMKDQVYHLRQRGIKAEAIHAAMTRDQIITALDNCILGGVKLLYVSPERLGSDLFQTKIRHAKVSFITVDEAHCISQWGYDFRPAYLRIAHIRRLLPGIPVLALTATATPNVVDDIQERLGFAEKNVFRMSFERANLAYVVRRAQDKEGELVHILSRTSGSAIVYVRSRMKAKATAALLAKAGISATFYHAGLDTATKDTNQRAWQRGEKRVMVATNAFGMGIDKADVRLVAHLDCPDSIEAYFQEAGRAGRDGAKSYAVLLYNTGDNAKMKRRIEDTFPDKSYIREVYDHLAFYYQLAVGSGHGIMFEFNLGRFCLVYKHFPVQVESALRILQRAGYIEYIEEQDNLARVKFLTTRDELYKLKNNSPDEDKLIVAMLRNYGGLFSDFCFIDEGLLALETGLPPLSVYHNLKSLREKRIINFIPRKRTPFIRYTQRREESKHLVFPPEVYSELRQRYQWRIAEMLRYASSDDHCRSRQLLAYFGEQANHDCGQCDVCLSRRDLLPPPDERRQAEEAILALLADGQRHRVAEILGLPQSRQALREALESLAEEEKLSQEDGEIFL